MSRRDDGGGASSDGPMDPGGAERTAIGRLPATPPCPFCGERETELHSAFGSHASVSTYWCRRCRSPFELLKWQSHAP